MAAVVGLLVVSASSLRAADARKNSADAEVKAVQFVYVSGEVKIPQRCVYTNGMTLSAAIKLAGGFTDSASPTEVKLTRGSKEPIVVDRRKIQEGKEKDFKLEPDDKVFVPRRK